MSNGRSKPVPDLPVRPLFRERSILIPVAFWVCLLCSAVLFASVSLAPRLVELHDLRLANLERQRQLIELEQHVQHMEKVVHALEYDPDFRSEVIRQEIGASADGETIPLDKSLTIDGVTPSESAPDVPLVVPWYIPILRVLSVPSAWRRRVVWISAGFCLFAFVALRERSRGSHPTQDASVSR